MFSRDIFRECLFGIIIISPTKFELIHVDSVAKHGHILSLVDPCMIYLTITHATINEHIHTILISFRYRRERVCVFRHDNTS